MSRGIRKMTDQDRSHYFQLAAEAEELRAKKVSIKAQIYQLIAQRIPSTDPRVVAAADELNRLDAEIENLSLESVAEQFEVSRQYAQVYMGRYMSGQSLNGRKIKETV